MFLLSYRINPQAQLLVNRKVESKFDVIKPDVITALDIKMFSTCCQRYTVEREILYKMQMFVIMNRGYFLV